MSQQIRRNYMKARRDYYRVQEKEEAKRLEADKLAEVKVVEEPVDVVSCDTCGKEFSVRGISNHKRACK